MASMPLTSTAAMEALLEPSVHMSLREQHADSTKQQLT